MISFPKFFNASEIGQGLKEVSTDILTTEYADIVTRWLHSADDADLFLWMDMNRTVIKQQLSFYGQVVEWNVVEGVKTGLIIEENQKEGGASETVLFDSLPQSGPIAQAIELLAHVTALSAEEREVLCNNLKNPQNIRTMSADQFNKRFGSFLDSRAMRSARPSLWARVKAWIFGKS